MRKLILILILLAIVSLSTVLYFFISHFSAPTAVVEQTPTVSISPMQTQTPTQIPAESTSTFCTFNQLSGMLSSEGAAGNIYISLTLMNTGKTSCEIILGNTVSAEFAANNIVRHNEQTVPSQNFILEPGAKVYSQIHYPNGPQCQSGITPKPISIIYKNGEIVVPFASDPQTGRLMIQACISQAEKTTVDIWPLSKNPITP